MTYAERGFGLASKKKRHSRGRRSVFGRVLQVYIELRRRASAWVYHSGAVGEGGLDGRVASNVLKSVREREEGRTEKKTLTLFKKNGAWLTPLDY